MSRRRVLYLGIDPSRYQTEGEVIHCPVIETVPVEQLGCDVQSAWARATDVLFTSPSAVRHWFGLCAETQGKKRSIAVGPGTCAELRVRGWNAVCAPFATQEGVIELLRNCQVGFLFWPRSALARPVLETYLRDSGISHFLFELYTTRTKREISLPTLDEFNEIVFTSPSTVRAFRELWGSWPPGIQITAIGPITKEALHDC
jgi:uroporphyrinogen-III synthase